MIVGHFRAAIFAALFSVSAPCLAQDVTLVSRDGALEVSGQLIAHDGELYRIASDFGILTIAAETVICEGPGCPDLMNLRTQIRISGLADIGPDLVASLFAEFARTKGWKLVENAAVQSGFQLVTADDRFILADILFTPNDLGTDLQTQLSEGRIDLALSASTTEGDRVRLLGHDALAILAAKDNPTDRITSADLVRVLTGEVTNWKEIGGPDMPLVLYSLPKTHPYTLALTERLGKDIASKTNMQTPSALLAALRQDPWGITVLPKRLGQSDLHQLKLVDSCGFVMNDTLLSVKSSDYPLTLPYHLTLPKRRLPALTREFLSFLTDPSAQTVIADLGLVDSRPIETPAIAEGFRLLNSIRAATDPAGLTELQRLTNHLERSDRLSITFRFLQGKDELEPTSLDQLEELARHIAAGTWQDRKLVLVGFSDGTGDPKANLTLSQKRAGAILDELKRLLPDLPAAALPIIDGYGAAMPLACDKTAAGRRLNRRVEVWLTPLPGEPAPDPSPQP